MKTKEEILKRHTELGAGCKVEYNITHDSIIKAMQEFADQQTSALREELEKTKYVLSEYQDECNNLFIKNTEQAQTIQSLQAENEKLKGEIAAYQLTVDGYAESTSLLVNSNQSLSARVSDLEEALKRIKLASDLGHMVDGKKIQSLLTSPQGDNK